MVASAIFVSTLMTVGYAAVAEDAETEPRKIERIYLVHSTHTDVGFTDHPTVCRDQQVRYLDVAIDASLATMERPASDRFYWTAEGTLAVDDWWRRASRERRADLLRAVKSGQIEIMALAMNQQAVLNAAQWQKMLHWMPEEIWQAGRPTTAMQVDVTGIPRAGAMAMLDRGVKNLWMASNTWMCREPLPRRQAFWWKMPDGRRLFVYMGMPYSTGFGVFHGFGWRRGPVPEVADTEFRPPRPGESYPADEDSVRAAHARIVNHVKGIESGGYDCPVLLMQDTNRWRMDNDPPAPQIADFVATWNRLQLKPQLIFTTAGPALEELKKHVGGKIPEVTGEWTEWWVNGAMSSPREMAAARLAKRKAAAATSKAWGPADEGTRKTLDGIYRDLCLWDEHTWGSADSYGLPDAVATRGQYNEKARSAYQALAMSKLLLARRGRTAVYGREDGFYIANTTDAPYTGWVTVLATCLRGDFKSLTDAESGRRVPLGFEPGFGQFRRPGNLSDVTRENEGRTVGDNFANALARFWIEDLPPQTVRRFLPSEELVAENESKRAAKPQVAIDENSWPTSAAWPGMERPLFDAAPGNFFAMKMQGLSPRWEAGNMINIAGAEAKKQTQAKMFKRIDASPERKTEVIETSHSTVYIQYMNHPSCKWLVREMEVFHARPRATLTLRFKRVSDELPEVLCATTSIPDDRLPLASSGGVPYTPYTDQLPKTCRDYFPIDGWLSYAGSDGSRLWATRDAPLVSFGGFHTLEGVEQLPERPGLIVSTLFDNTWMTNFLADQHGVLEYRFDMLWKPKKVDAQEATALTDAMALEPPVVINVKERENPIYMKRLHQP